MTHPSPAHQTTDRVSVLFVGSPPVDLEAACASDRKRAVDIDIVSDGRAALTRLTAVSASPCDESPDLVLVQCDFELPDGLTLLGAIKTSPRLNTLPVVVLDPDATEAGRAYQLGGNAYVPLPDSTAEYTALIDSLTAFWVGHAQYPGECLYSNK